MLIPAANALRANACPIRPMPMMPSVLPYSEWLRLFITPKGSACPARSLRSNSAVRLATSCISAKANSAVGSITGCGVLVTRMPRSRQASRSMLLNPTPKLVTSFSFGADWINSRITGLSKVLTSTSASSSGAYSSCPLSLTNPSPGNMVVNAIFTCL